MNTKKIMVFVLLQLAIVGITTSLSANADTLSDLRAQCPNCHNVIVSPSGWSLNGSATGRQPAEKTFDGWLSVINAMGDGACGFNNVGPGGTSRADAAQFMYGMQYTTSPPPPTLSPTPTPTPTPTPISLTSINVVPVNHTINVGQAEQFAATGVFSDGTTQDLTTTTIGTFNAAGSMVMSRSGHTATLLKDGNVLIIGASYTSTVDFYNAVSGVFGATGTLAAPRSLHTSTLLGDGKVLVAGGYNYGPSLVLATAELYNPASGTFSATGTMKTARFRATATLLGNGKVLIAGGGAGYGQSISEAEIYNPTTGIFEATGAMSVGRDMATATLLKNGKVLIVGGGSSTAELYDPASGIFTATGAMGRIRVGHTATLLENGKVLVVGGYSGSYGLYDPAAELYDPATGTFSATGAMVVASRSLHTATLLENGKVLVSGGQVDPGRSATSELYDPATNTFSAANAMLSIRSEFTATALNSGKVLMAGGVTQSGETATAELYTLGSLWSSSNTNVATINRTGLATGVGSGTTTISATLGNVSGNTSLMVIGGQPDLAITAVSSSVATVLSGKTFTFSSTTKNQGTAATTATSTGLYLSTDATITTADTLIGSVSIGSLAAGASQSAATSVTVSKKLARGTYYLGAIADYLGAQTESNESNNSFTGTTIQVK